ncbi:MAG TPA: amidohydrolase family protein [Thermodesulfobacteriota bacterium]
MPVSDAPIEAGAVRVVGERIAAVGPRRRAPGDGGLWAEPGEPIVDLGDAALLPGLVDAHAHLEWAALRTLLDGQPLEAWPRVFPRIRAAWTSPEDYMVSARLGALEAIEAGITTVADSGPTGAGLEAMREVGLGGRVYAEVIGPDPEAWETLADAVERQVERLEAAAGTTGGRLGVGLAPHALHTVSTPLLRWCRRFADARGLALSVHLAESAAEVRFLEAGDGPWADLYARAGVRAVSPRRSPAAAAAEVGLLARGTILAHCVRLDAADIARVGASGAAVACCPQSNAALGVGDAPAAELLAAGVTVGLGTDSGASVGAKDLFAEARALRGLLGRAARGPVVGARPLLEAMTRQAARALGLESEIGSIEVGKRADLVAVALDRPHLRGAADVEAALVGSAGRGDVTWVMTAGEVRVERGVARIPGRQALLEAADRLAERTRAALPDTRRRRS